MADEQNAGQVEYIDTPEQVDHVFREQRKLSFTYGVIFFTTVLLIPLLSITSEWWYGQEIWGGFTLNYLIIALLYHIFYVSMGYFYAKQANALEDKLLGEIDSEVGAS